MSSGFLLNNVVILKAVFQSFLSLYSFKGEGNRFLVVEAKIERFILLSKSIKRIVESLEYPEVMIESSKDLERLIRLVRSFKLHFRGVTIGDEHLSEVLKLSREERECLGRQSVLLVNRKLVIRTNLLDSLNREIEDGRKIDKVIVATERIPILSSLSFDKIHCLQFQNIDIEEFQWIQLFKLNSVRKLKFEKCTMIGKMTKEMATALNTNTSITSLTLNLVKVGGFTLHISEMINLLNSNQTLRKFVTNLYISDPFWALHEDPNHMTTNSTIQKLHIPSKNMHDKWISESSLEDIIIGSISFEAVIKYHSNHLRVLKIDFVNYCPHFYQELIVFVKGSKTLASLTLDYSSHSLRPERFHTIQPNSGVFKSLLKALQECPSLKHFSVHDLIVNMKDLTMFFGSLYPRSLSYLELKNCSFSANPIPKDDIRRLAGAINKCQRLIALSLNGLKIADQSQRIKFLSDILSNQYLSHLNLLGLLQPEDFKFKESLLQVIRANKTLLSLSLTPLENSLLSLELKEMDILTKFSPNLKYYLNQ